MLTISVSHNIEQTIAGLKNLERQLPFAVARALTQTAKQAQMDVTAKLPEIFDRPNPFTLRGIGWERADKIGLTASVFIRPKVAEYLRKQITGGTYLPKRRALALPTDVEYDPYGNVKRSWLRRMRARKDVFSGTVHGIPGLWQRSGRGVTLLLAYEPRAEYRPIFAFGDIVKASVARNFMRLFERSMLDAIASAR